MVPRLYMLMVPHFKSGEYCDSSCAQIWFPSPKLGICLKGTSNKKQFQLVWKNNPCGSQESSMTFFWGDLESQKLGSFETLGPQKQLVSPWKNTRCLMRSHEAPGENPYSYIPLTLGYRSIHIISPYTVVYPCGSMANTPSPSPLPIPTYFMLVGQSIN
jgi:hypothetical protein